MTTHKMLCTATTTVALMAVPLMGVAHADGAEGEGVEPLTTTFEVDEGPDEPGRTPRPWRASVDGEFTPLPFSEDGLVSFDVLASGHPDLTSMNQPPDIAVNRPYLVATQRDDDVGETFRGCPDTDELAPSPVTMTSDDPSWEYVPETGERHEVEPGAIWHDTRAVVVQSVSCRPASDAEGGSPMLISQDHYVQDADGEGYTRIASATAASFDGDGNQYDWSYATGWEFLEEYRQQPHMPQDMTPEEWADRLVEKGIVPADKRWFVTGGEPGKGPIVDTGRTVPASSEGAPWAAGLAGLGLLGAGAGTVAVARRRA
ncbi:hypothetical protein [Kytococcus sedentarius]|uniref:hypothetical protein n=1 Tax=Kytococcus sedentarius TaxID=1276 RepID=UPI0035BBB0E2